MSFLRAAALGLVLVASSFAHVIANEFNSVDRLAAWNAYERAQEELRAYWLVEYPRQLRELDAAIELSEKELANNKALLREYRPFSRFSTGNPFPMTQRNLELHIRSVELRLDCLKSERNNLVRYRSDRFQALTARARQARDRLQAIDVAIAASTSTVEPLPPQHP